MTPRPTDVLTPATTAAVRAEIDALAAWLGLEPV